MTKLHYGICLVGVALAAAVVVAFGIELRTLAVFAMALACPVAMLVMMRLMHRQSAAPTPPAEVPPDRR